MLINSRTYWAFIVRGNLMKDNRQFEMDLPPSESFYFIGKCVKNGQFQSPANEIKWDISN